MEIKDYKRISNYGKFPIQIDNLIDLDKDNNLVSRKWGEILFDSSIIFKYEDDANERDYWYLSMDKLPDNKYELWLDYRAELKAMSGETKTTIITNLELDESDSEILKEVEYQPEINDKEESDWNF
jgi:hypothetical protein